MWISLGLSELRCSDLENSWKRSGSRVDVALTAKRGIEQRTLEEVLATAHDDRSDSCTQMRVEISDNSRISKNHAWKDSLRPGTLRGMAVHRRCLGMLVVRCVHRWRWVRLK